VLDNALMDRVHHGRLPAALGVAAALLIAGCGSDSSGDSTATQISIPSPTSPIATSPQGTTTQAKGQGKQKGGQPTTSTVAGGCTIPDTYQNFKFTGLPCATAVSVATAWDSNGEDCNTIDDPSSPEGFKRTCSVEDYTCTAKRDVHSDARFVTCTKGGGSVRFTWLPV
jgi:hypothetical protein